jgi:hypothetical protein
MSRHATSDPSRFRARLLLPLSGLAAVTLVVAVTAAMAASPLQPWHVDFASAQGVRPAMTVAEAARRWQVSFAFSTGSDPTWCKIGGFSRDGVVGGALFESGRFHAVWFERGVIAPGGVRVGSGLADLRRVYGTRLRKTPNIYDPTRPLYFVRGGEAKLFLEFFLTRTGRIKNIGFGDRAVFVQEGCN